ncbi:hypothetical protein C475_16114 [Halosimplex carlsbadense 2-9-1]|uniref:Uncharacterized protein n=1 Tax=Halosimplex carlsbadense 2-9-1 TaxID=797114 RepID=M0CIS4_9EURY|nr:hypothetical protein [Halosimplex carlsbadense]ELZ23190.1 hypothetical protein C475_16114 [Halosimplex carlsbadense 2-9-1]
MSGGDSGGEDGAAGSGTGRSAKWRCAWCDKPHDRNDPPCDNCGHHKFEKAVVPVAPEDPDHEREPVWVCPECGRVHQKNSPPCSRCGNAELERQIPDESDYDEELSGTSYYDLLDARYLVGLAFALVAGAVLVLALLGVITLPGMDSVPGSAGEYRGVNLGETETALVAAVNDRRAEAGLSEYERNGNVDDAARLYNQGLVSEVAGTGSIPSGERLGRALDGTCDDGVERITPFTRSFDEGAAALDSPEALAGALADGYTAEAGGLSEAESDLVGVDVHAGPDGSVYATVFVC